MSVYEDVYDESGMLTGRSTPMKENQRDREVKFDPTKPVQTRNGYPVRVLCTDLKDYTNKGRTLAVAIQFSSPSGDYEGLAVRYADGLSFHGAPYTHNLDLVNVPSIKLEVGAHYRLRNGRVAVILEQRHSMGIFCGSLIGDAKLRKWFGDGAYKGSWNSDNQGTSTFDIVERIS